MFERFNDYARRVVVLATDEAVLLNHNYIGAEHIILGLVREGVLGRVVGREREIGQAMEILMLEAAVPLLIGEHGAGVTAVAHGMAQAMAQARPSRWFAGKRLMELNLDRLTAPPTNCADLDDRISDLITLIRDQRGTIWFIDNSLRLADTSAAGTVPAITLLRPVLATGELLAIAATTPTEHGQHLGAGTDLGGDFTDIHVSELPGHLAVEVLKSVRDRQQARHQVSIDDEVIAAAVALSVQHIPGSLLPGKAIDLLDRAAAHTAGRNPLQQLTGSLARVRRKKEVAIDNQDFVTAANFRDEEKRLIRSIDQKEAELRNRPSSSAVAVTRQDLTTALTAQIPAAAASGGRYV